MALKINVSETKTGVSFPDAYARIAGFSGNKNEIKIFVEVHVNEAARRAEAQRIVVKTISMPFSEITGELLPSMYQWLKLQPLFANSTDC